MVAKKDINRAAYLAARLDDINRAIEYSAAGAGLSALEVSPAESDGTSSVHVRLERPIVVSGLDQALEEEKARLEAELRALGVT